MTLKPDEERVLRRHTKAVCHLSYAARHGRQLGFILGAGVSADLNIPTWGKLLENIEKELGYTGQAPFGPEGYRAEQLFQFYRKTRSQELSFADREVKEAGVNTGWRQIVSKFLYEKYLDANGKPDLIAYEKAINDHPYLRQLAQIAGRQELVVTHNFDNALEYAVATDPSNPNPPNRRYNAFWKPDPFLRPGMLNIYHPNGYSPTEGLKGSDSIILTEANFADHLANTNSAEAAFLLNHLSNKTWLLIGHSLGDGTLKNALRLHAGRRPGHVGYFIHWVDKGQDALPEAQREAIREANFVTYNLYTFFLTSAEIAALLSLINKEEIELEYEVMRCGLESRYTYYIVGSVSSGKSTVLSHLRSVATVEEWPDRMPPAMNKLSVDASTDEKAEIDNKLREAIWKKNGEISATKVGLVAVDRAPLDFIAFPDQPAESSVETAKNRHTNVLGELAQNGFAKMSPGQVIFVETDPHVLLERQLQRGRPSSDGDLQTGAALKALEHQQALMLEIYKPAIAHGSIVRGDCCSVAECVQDVVRIIYFSDYLPFDFKGRLESYLAGAP